MGIDKDDAKSLEIMKFLHAKNQLFNQKGTAMYFDIQYLRGALLE